ncbi:hypothetical protein [Pseudoalteromonas sp. T1lg75]|uniref:hypothetical protein n=1 Tax=Pseudoalteromonas sp. T1lg75 TaxID=2077102 RepID=UPI000CF6E6B9|nr:hypothetical protein [Pseudoalteromonas sp. T1lg75]
MIVPKYWSESQAKTRANDRQYTIKRFGWSDISEEDAKQHAQQRLGEALKTLSEQGDVRRIDHKISYNGAEGIPIREEVVANHQDVVISRNSYGALCLNTPDVMFADIDLDSAPSTRLVTWAFIGLALIGAATALVAGSWWVLFAAVLVSLLLASTLAGFINNRLINRRGGLEQEAITRFKQVSADNPALHMRIYQTSMGFRILFMEQTYEPTSESAAALLKSLGSDRVYMQMCRNQRCFRARVSPKPWRVGIERLRPRPGVWPIKAERLKERQDWIRTYERKAKGYASCKFMMKLGSDITDPKTIHVMRLHDDLCKANREYSLA